MVDVDHFKLVNDKIGHDVGDACLRAMVNLVRLSLSAKSFDQRRFA